MNTRIEVARQLTATRRHQLLALSIAIVAAVVAALPPLPQDPAYHALADRRTLLGIPNCLDVVSNLGFAIVGLAGLLELRRWDSDAGQQMTRWERHPYRVLFIAILLTAIGSSYYHLAPDNARLVWDRLPMSIGFMALLTTVWAERAGLRSARAMFAPLLVLGAASVLWWHWTELQGAGDLRLYVATQFGSLVVVVMLLLLYPPRYPGTRYLVIGLALYGVAKLFELADASIFSVGRIVSGHTLKHVVAAAGVGCLAVMLRISRTYRNSIRTARPASVSQAVPITRQSGADEG